MASVVFALNHLRDVIKFLICFKNKKMDSVFKNTLNVKKKEKISNVNVTAPLSRSSANRIDSP